MRPADENAAEQCPTEQFDGGNLPRAEQELLSRVRAVAQQITERVRKALGDEYPERPQPDPDGPLAPPA